MNYQNRRGGGVDYVNLYFGWEVWRAVINAVAKVFAWVIAIGSFLTWEFVKDSVPDDYSTFVVCVIVAGWAIGVPTLLFLWFRSIGRRAQEKDAKWRRDWAPEGALRNPDPPWFDANGNRLWKRDGNQWVRLETPRWEK